MCRVYIIIGCLKNVSIKVIKGFIKYELIYKVIDGYVLFKLLFVNFVIGFGDIC